MRKPAESRRRSRTPRIRTPRAARAPARSPGPRGRRGRRRPPGRTRPRRRRRGLRRPGGPLRAQARSASWCGWSTTRSWPATWRRRRSGRSTPGSTASTPRGGSAPGCSGSASTWAWTCSAGTTAPPPRRSTGRAGDGRGPFDLPDPDPRIREELAQEVRFVLGADPGRRIGRSWCSGTSKGFSSAEVAAIVGRREATVRWRLAKAREMFREHWERRQG